MSQSRRRRKSALPWNLPMRLVAFSFVFLLAALPPAIAQEREWSLDAQDEDAYLIFGVPESDDVGVSFWCKLGSDQVKMFFPEGAPGLKANHSEKFEVQAGGKTFAMRGKTADNELLGSVSIETDAAISSEVITALQASDRFSSIIAGHTTIYPLIDSGLDDFVKLCRVK
jgi:hypothetical protein